MYVYNLPTTRAVSFADCFHTSRWTLEISQATEKRAKLQHAIKTVVDQKTSAEEQAPSGIGLLSQKDWIKVVQSADDYLPYLYSIYNSIKTDDVLLKGELMFAWKETLSASSSKSMLPGIQYELVSVLTLQAKALSNLAASLVASLGDYEHDAAAATLSDEERKRKEDRLRFAADLQCRASGVFEYVGKVIIPEWENLEGIGQLLHLERSIDSSGELCFALSRLAHAEAELLAIRKLLSPCACYQTAHRIFSPPLASNHPSPSLLSKLYLNVASLYESALSLSQTASSKASLRLEKSMSSSSNDSPANTTQSSRSFGSALRSKITPRSIEENAASGKISRSFAKYLFKRARGSRATAYFWLAVDRGERGQYGEALSFFKLANDEVQISSQSSRIHLPKNERSKEETRELAKEKEDLLQRISQYSTAYKQLNDSVAFQPLPNSSSLTSQIPTGRAATTIKPFIAPAPAFGPGSVDSVASGIGSLNGLDKDKEDRDDKSTPAHEYAGQGAYY